MNSQLKRLSLVLAIQFACIGTGFWVEKRFLDSFSERAAIDAVWQQSDANKSETLAVIRAADRVQAAPDQVLNILRSASPQLPWQATLLDDEGHPIRNLDNHESISQTHAHWQWQPLRPFIDHETAPRRGILSIDEQPHAAIAYPMPHSSGFLVTHVPLADVRMTRQEALQARPLAMTLSILWTCTLSGICTYLIGARVCEAISASKLTADANALKKAQLLARTQDAVIFGLANLAESRDPETGQHLERIALYATTLAQALRNNPKYQTVVTDEFVRLIGTGSALHDIGKVGIEDAILRKKGKLKPQERKEIQKHPVIGSECLLKIERRLGATNFLQMAREIARSHHEWWDGSGYPDGRAGDEIPLAARIVSIADVYDALATRRVYKPEFPHVACVGFIEQGRGTQFDPELVDTFLLVESAFRRIAARYADIVPANSHVHSDSPTRREHADFELPGLPDDDEISPTPAEKSPSTGCQTQRSTSVTKSSKELE